jgi:hypothetical protein
MLHNTDIKILENVLFHLAKDIEDIKQNLQKKKKPMKTKYHSDGMIDLTIVKYCETAEGCSVSLSDLYLLYEYEMESAELVKVDHFEFLKKLIALEYNIENFRLQGYVFNEDGIRLLDSLKEE